MVADDIDFLGQLGPEFGTDEGDQGGDGIDFLRDIFSFGDNGMTSPVASPRAGGDFHSRPLSPSQTLKDGQTTIKVRMRSLLAQCRSEQRLKDACLVWSKHSTSKTALQISQFRTRSYQVVLIH